MRTLAARVGLSLLAAVLLFLAVPTFGLWPLMWVALVPALPVALAASTHKRAFLYGWLSLALFSFRELTLATMLFSPDNITLSVVVWSLWHSGNIAQASAVVLIMMALLLPLVLIYLRIGRATRAF